MHQETPPQEFDWRRPQTFLAVAGAAVTAPRQFFAQITRGGGFLAPVAFFLLAMLAPTLVNALLQWSQGPLAMLNFFATSLLKSAVMLAAFALVLHGVCRLAFRTTLKLPDVLRIVCYASGVRALEFLPLVLSSLAGGLLSIIIVLFIAYLVWVGLQAAGGLSRYQALGALMLAFVTIVGLWLAVNFLRGVNPLPDLPVPPSPDGVAPAPPAGQP